VANFAISSLAASRLTSWACPPQQLEKAENKFERQATEVFYTVYFYCTARNCEDIVDQGKTPAVCTRLSRNDHYLMDHSDLTAGPGAIPLPLEPSDALNIPHNVPNFVAVRKYPGCLVKTC
jgi:hypothetical protein